MQCRNGIIARLHGLILDVGETRVSGIGMVNVHRDTYKSAMPCNDLQIAKLSKQHADIFCRKRIGKAGISLHLHAAHLVTKTASLGGGGF